MKKDETEWSDAEIVIVTREYREAESDGRRPSSARIKRMLQDAGFIRTIAAIQRRAMRCGVSKPMPKPRGHNEQARTPRSLPE